MIPQIREKTLVWNPCILFNTFYKCIECKLYIKLLALLTREEQDAKS